ncbi:hypothetical protein QRX60_12215 [Amycolatopsis mongoliensis]|uniref:S1 motif domain-containing protein n=1 Tax=Amycolatopsis mongoliensis TaxID=715475 RepID=A0A9Y2JVS4_9PSEU|nr:hypothetical protein [Amycolatopsis sp. 4-36]WIY04566.1 hypothetical protein QRX60_12215 [Amycolatopsis sp. 4-36]
MTGFEVGAVVTGTVSAIPRPGAIGLFVDLDGEGQGFVDVLILPRRPGSWPAVGTKTTFEVLARRSGQIRLWPLEAEFRSGPLDNGVSEDEWRARKARYPEGAVLTAEVSDVHVGSYLVRYEGGWSLLEGDGAPPEVGSSARYEVVRHLDTTRRTLLRPAGT